MRRLNSSAPTRSGFTLVEILVVTGVIALLLSLLLPAVQQTREAARRTQCCSRMKQIALALHGYHEVHSTFPPASIRSNVHNINESLLPFLDQVSLYAQLDFRHNNNSFPNLNALTGVKLEFQVCPSNPQHAAVGGYDGMWSQGAAFQPCAGPYRFPLGPDRYSDCYAAGLPGYCAAGEEVTATSGMFALSIAAHDYSCRMAHVTDGLSQTLMLGEVLPQWNLFFGIWSGQANGFITAMKPNSPRRIQPGTVAIPSVGYLDALNRNHGLASFHPGGVHAARADGSTMFLSENIDFAVLNRMGNKQDGHVIVAF